MTEEDALALEQFVKDHDTRFQPKAIVDSAESHVLLTQPANGEPLEPVRSVADYKARFIEGPDPGPTIREAWEKWMGERKGA